VNASQRKENGPHLAAANNPGLLDKTYVVGSRPLKVDDALRQPGDLIPEARDWSYKLRSIYIDQGLIEEVNLITDDARQTFQRQWDQERQARFEAAKMAPKPDTWSIPDHKQGADNERFIGHKDNLPPLTLKCANCRYAFGFDHPVDDDERWMCTNCGQWQTGEQSRLGTLQIIRSPASSVNHNHAESYWWGGDAS
jgi:hypothetical protein